MNDWWWSFAACSIYRPTDRNTDQYFPAPFNKVIFVSSNAATAMSVMGVLSVVECKSCVHETLIKQDKTYIYIYHKFIYVILYHRKIITVPKPQTGHYLNQRICSFLTYRCIIFVWRFTYHITYHILLDEYSWMEDMHLPISNIYNTTRLLPFLSYLWSEAPLR